MKKFLILIIILTLGFGALYYMRGDNEGATTQNDSGDKVFRPDPKSATFRFDDSSVTLSNGKGVEKDGNTVIQETNLLDERAYGDLNSDGEEDAVVLLSQSGGGSGVFIYVAGYVSGPVSYKGTSAIFLGDRISPQSVSVSGGVVTVKYLDRNPDQAFAEEPTVPTSKQFIYRDGEFVER